LAANDADFRKLRVCLNFYWKLFEWITARYEKTNPGWLKCDHMDLKPKPFSEAKTGFFHYEPLSASSFRKNLSTLGAIEQTTKSRSTKWDKNHKKSLPDRQGRLFNSLNSGKL